ncbi:hypothetical protein [Saccharophagus sp. K07]|uniref:hypothetical protein n=1 Tax=Saccharophagus sp. K07 TaxID=2283636 RepID=UPI0016529E26|nr:hypothetical protein [Saccharophagus sp. K07]
MATSLDKTSSIFPVPVNSIKYHLIHAATSIDQNRCQNGERATIFDFPRSAKQLSRDIHRASINPAQHSTTTALLLRIVNARKPRKRINHDHDVMPLARLAAGGATVTSAGTLRLKSVTSSGRSSINSA